MRRWITSILAVSLAAMPLMALDKAAEKKEEQVKQFRQLEKTRAALIKAYEDADTDEERQKIVEKYRKLRDEAPKVWKMIEADPKDTLACDMLVFALQMDPKQHEKVFKLLSEHHARNPKLDAVMQMLANRPPESSRKLLEKALEENPSKDVKGRACFALAKLAAEKAGEGDKKAEQEAEKYYDRVAKDFADVKSGEETLGDQAKIALFEIRHLSIGKTAPNVESVDLKGKKVQLKDYKGKVVVLDIWATWCGPCKAMIPHERDMVKKLKGKPFALISISADAKKQTITDFVEKEGMPWAHWWNGANGGILKDWNVQFFPTIYVLDSEGVIRYKNVRGQELEDAVEKLIAEVKDKK